AHGTHAVREEARFSHYGAAGSADPTRRRNGPAIAVGHSGGGTMPTGPASRAGRGPGSRPDACPAPGETNTDRAFGQAMRVHMATRIGAGSPASDRPATRCTPPGPGKWRTWSPPLRAMPSPVAGHATEPVRCTRRSSPVCTGSSCSCQRHPGIASVPAGEVQEPAAVVVLEVGEVVAEGREVVADANLEIPADVAVHAQQPAVALAAVGHVQAAKLGQGVPFVAQAQAKLQRGQGRAAVEPFAGAAAHAVFAPAAGELAGDLPALVELADALEREHVAALVVAGAADLAAAGQVVEVGVPAEGGPARAAMRAPGEAQVDLAELGFVVGAE